MQPTENLTKDHEIIKEMLGVMNQIAAKAKQTQAVDAADMDVVINFLQHFCDGYHHTKEEEKLFPMIEKAGIPKQGPISVMIEDHEIGRNTLTKIVDAVQAIRNGDVSLINGLVANLTFYTDFLASHIYKEDVILFPMSERVLLDPQKEELAQYFVSVGEKVLGADGLQTYLDQIAVLKAKY